MSYLGQVFESLANKNSKFSKIPKFLALPGFRSELKSQNEKTEKTENCQFGWMLSYFVAVCFLKLLILFFVWKSFFRLVLVYFPAFLAFPAFLSNWAGPKRSPKVVWICHLLMKNTVWVFDVTNRQNDFYNFQCYH